MKDICLGRLKLWQKFVVMGVVMMLLGTFPSSAFAADSQYYISGKGAGEAVYYLMADFSSGTPILKWDKTVTQSQATLWTFSPIGVKYNISCTNGGTTYYLAGYNSSGTTYKVSLLKSNSHSTSIFLWIKSTKGLCCSEHYLAVDPNFYMVYSPNNITIAQPILYTPESAPVLTWKVIYNTTFHHNVADNKDEIDNVPFVGVAVTPLLTDGIVKAGDIVDMINNQIQNHVTDAPADLSHILYVDATGVNTVSPGANGDDALLSLRVSLAPNALIFYPSIATSITSDNVIYHEISNTYKSFGNIVLTDKQPFYTPYQIETGTEHYAIYTRQLAGTNTSAEQATLILPFTVELNNGMRTEERCTFTAYQMQTENCLNNVSSSDVSGNTGKNIDAKFTALTTRTSANVPFHVVVNSTNLSSGTFEIKEPNAVFAVSTYSAGDYCFTDQNTASGTIGEATYTFASKGTYAGITVPKEDGIFYFANGCYYSSKNLSANYPSVYINPFRGYYTCSATGTSKALDIDALKVVFDDNHNPASVDALSASHQVTVETGKGCVWLTAFSDSPLTIYSLSGQRVYSAMLHAGSTQRVTLQRGIYLIGGNKFVIR